MSAQFWILEYVPKSHDADHDPDPRDIWPVPVYAGPDASTAQVERVALEKLTQWAAEGNAPDPDSLEVWSVTKP